MKAMILERVCDLNVTKNPLKLADLSMPEIGDHEVLIKVSTCGVCHTEIDEIEGRTPPSKFPVVLGHQIVGRVADRGKSVKNIEIGERVGVGWIGYSCGKCKFCAEERENLCDSFRATGRDVNGGYAEYTKARADYVFRIPDSFTDEEAAPLLCAGAIGYRSVRLAQITNGDPIGLIGFGASAHIVIQMIKYLYPASQVLVFARSENERHFAMELGAHWAGDIDEKPPIKIKCAIDTTPVWRPVIYGLRNLEKGGRLIINAIRKEDRDRQEISNINYAEHLWLEKELKTVANVTRTDIREFLELAAKIPIKPEFQTYDLTEANKAISDLKERKIKGAKVLKVE
ncbi:MAG: zinc-dependent alcohol dehydrogenase family protein [Deltaproteobacteria bacterium]|nr:zinc-dependent alcohol dehydrogenase family protein [Deltaproteobacteria bacterium]